ncbi:MAG: T9SS type A sorting domain-containing protein [Saprospiraceae bacterium]|nr:T9SS type A sorting domain-containing protein [Lewinella sp.]
MFRLPGFLTLILYIIWSTTLSAQEVGVNFNEQLDFVNIEDLQRTEAYELFREYEQIAVATYAYRQSFPSAEDFTSEHDPWTLNGLYMNRTVVPDSLGRFQFNYTFMDDFHRIQGITTDIIRPQESEVKVAIAPNPFGRWLSIDLPTAFGRTRLHLFNVHGQLIYQTHLTSGVQRLNIGDLLPAGWYLLDLRGQNGIHQQMKLIHSNPLHY